MCYIVSIVKTEFAPPIRSELTSSPEKIAKNIRDITSFYQSQGIDARIIGSLGRQAVLPQENFSFYKPTGEARDIDILLLVNDRDIPSSIVANAQLIAKHDIAHNCFFQRDGKLFIRYRDIFIEVNPKITQLRMGVLADSPIPTVDPNLLFHLSALYLSMRPKDRKNLIQFAKQLKGNRNHLPNEIFEPFHTIIDLKQQKYPLDAVVAIIRYVYQEDTPMPIQNILRPVLKPIHDIYMSTYRRDFRGEPKKASPNLHRELLHRSRPLPNVLPDKHG